MSGSDDVVEPLIRSIRDFARSNIRSLEIDREHTIPPAVLRGLGELGLFGVTLPLEWGGAGLSALDATRVVIALAEADRSVATTIGLHLGLGTRALVAWGTRAQQEKWLPSLATGEAIAAFATTEPEAGSDLSALKAVAAAGPDGRLHLSGTKLYVTNAAFASLLTVTASTPGLGGAARGTSLLLVDPKAPGSIIQPEERKLGLRGSSTRAFIFEDVTLGPDAVLGEPGQGASQLAHVLSWGRLLLSAGCVGTARTALKASLEHVHHRRQFQRALIQQEVVQHRLARASAVAFGMSALVETAASAENDWELLARLTTSSKVFCSEGGFEIADLAIQLHGGSGYIEDTGMAVLMRDARVTRIFEGANDVLLTHAGLMELTQPAKSPTEALRVPRHSDSDRSMTAHPERSRGGDSLGDTRRPPSTPLPTNSTDSGPFTPSEVEGPSTSLRPNGPAACSFEVMCGEAAPLLGMNGTAIDLEVLAPLWQAVTTRREAMGAGIRALNKRAWQHSLGWAVVWRDAATAATLRAKTPLEQACASLLREEAIALAATPHGPAGPTAVLSAALLEGVLP